MFVNEILNTEAKSLTQHDSISHALVKMDLASVMLFPVTDEEGKLIGMADLKELIKVDDNALPISSTNYADPISVNVDQHVFEAARIMLAKEVYALPVISAEGIFEGMVLKKEVLEALSVIFNLKEFGSVITVSMEQFDYTLSELVRIVELEGAKILGIAVQQPSTKKDSFHISLKLNVEDSSKVSAALRRYGFLVTSEANSKTLEADFSNRADELIRYLDI